MKELLIQPVVINNMNIKGRIIDYLCSLGFVHYYRHMVHGPVERLHWSKSKNKETINAIFNTRSGHIYIGEHVIIGHDTMFLTGRHMFENGKLKQPKSTQVPTEGYDIRIGAGSWIASGAIVIGGVTLGENCIVAAGAVVTDNFPDGCILAGVPAKIVGHVDKRIEDQQDGD
jgi:acetyltransferase-like isoleucine patch superfamily enzyme